MGGWIEDEKTIIDGIREVLVELLGDKYASRFEIRVMAENRLMANVQISYRGALLKMIRSVDHEYFNNPDVWIKGDMKRLRYEILRFIENEMTDLLHEILDIAYICRKKGRVSI